MKTGGFTLMEILVAMVLMATVGAVAFSSFSSGAKIGQNNRNVAVNVGRGVLENLYEAVRDDWWPNAGHPLTPGGPTAQPNVTLNGVTYSSVKTVSSPGGGTDYRRARVTVCWNQGTCPLCSDAPALH